MKVAFDISAQASRKSGVGYYQYHLIKELSLLLKKQDSLTLFGFNYRNFKKLRSAVKDQQLKINIRFFKIPHRLILFLWIYFKLPLLNSFVSDYDIYQVSELAIPPLKNGKSVAFVHDLTTLVRPQYHTSSNIFLHKRRFKNLNKVDAILVNSQSTKNDLMRLLSIPEAKIHVTYLAADEKFKPLPKSKVELILKKYSLKNPYLLFVGTIEPRKNLSHLILSFEKLKHENMVDHQLILVGQKGWKCDLIFDQIKNSPFSNDIIYLDYIDEGDLPGLYNGADIFVYPSFYEGFGLPILEAMQCGVPVITSMVSSMPEVGGDACLYVDPHSSDQLYDRISHLIKNTDLKKTLSKKGIEQAKKFSWKKCAKETLRVYRSLLD